MRNTLYLYIHRIMINKTDESRIIPRKDALVIMSRCVSIPKSIRDQVLRDMIKKKLIEKINRDKIKIINCKKSKEFENAIISGIKKDQRGF